MSGALLRLAWASAWHRRFGLSLVVLSVALSSFLLLAVDRLRTDVRTHFAQAVSGTDLIVGARGGSTQLLLYSVFRLGGATRNIRWSSVQALAADPAVAWVVPLSLGDSHRGFPVVGTTGAYFEHFRHGDKRALAFAHGARFGDVFDAVLGNDVAARLGYRIGDSLVLNHGGIAMPGTEHADKPFRVAGILEPTGTPVDRSIHIGLDGLQAIHLDWVAGVPMPAMKVPAQQVREHDLTPRSVTAALVGLRSRSAVFSVQRRIADFEAEALMGILPGVALDELWEAVDVGERALALMAALVGLVSLAGLVAVIVAGLEQRRRELAVLRSVGAGPRTVFALLALEGIGVTVLGVLLGALACALAIALAGPWLAQRYGVAPALDWPQPSQWLLAGQVVLAGSLASALPGWRAYRLSLADGLTPKG